MKKLMSVLAVLTLANVSTLVMAATPQSDAREAADMTVTTKTVNLRCEGGKPLKVTYGFNRQGLPTYAQAYLNGKSRFMPINLYSSNRNMTEFGDDNNFSLHTLTGAITKQRYRSTIQLQDPASQIVYNRCLAR